MTTYHYSDWFMKYRSANHMKRNLEKSTSLVQLAEKLFTSEKYEETLVRHLFTSILSAEN